MGEVVEWRIFNFDSAGDISKLLSGIRVKEKGVMEALEEQEERGLASEILQCWSLDRTANPSNAPREGWRAEDICAVPFHLVRLDLW